MTLNLLNHDDIVRCLQTKTIGHPIHCLQTIDSTNNECKRRALDEQEGMVVVSEHQTAGRGRLGRQWISPKAKGIWMSILLKPDIPSAHIPQLTSVAAATVCLALEKEYLALQDKVEIKWPNDILIRGRKVGGILTEMQISGDHVHSVVLGIGLNVSLEMADFPEELRSIATSLSQETGMHLCRERIIAGILNSFESLYVEFLRDKSLGQTLTICRQKSAVIGKEVTLLNQGVGRQAMAMDIGSQGELLVRLDDGQVISVISGEISLRLTP